jgi:ATP-binding cassette, subfamily B, bacterial
MICIRECPFFSKTTVSLLRLVLIIGKFAPLQISESIGVGDIQQNNTTAIRRAARHAGADSFIQKLPLGYDTKLRDDKRQSWSSRCSSYHDKRRVNFNGSISKSRQVEKSIHSATPVEFSGGQWQRLALSRSFMRAQSADLLILDEPSSSLDPEAEHKLFKYIQQIRSNKTMIYVTHRFYTVRLATKIIFLEDGMLIESGGHDELMAIPGGKYAKLYKLQSEGFSSLGQDEDRD